MTNEAIPNLKAFDEAALDKAFAALEKQAREDAAALDDEEAMEAFRLEWLGRKQGRLNEVSGRWLKAAPAEAKKALGCALQRAQGSGGGAAGAAAGGGPSDVALGRGHRHYAAGDAAADRRRASDYAHDERDCRRFCRAGLLGGRGAGGRDRLLQLREHELSVRASGAGYAGYAGGGRARSADRCATGCCCARTPRRCRCGPWSSSRRRCAS